MASLFLLRKFIGAIGIPHNPSTMGARLLRKLRLQLLAYPVILF